MGQTPDSVLEIQGLETRELHKQSTRLSGKQWHPPNGLFVAFFLSGAAGLIYEVAWTKSLGLFFGHTVFANATVLGVFMGGLAAGSAWIGRWSERPTHPFILYGWIELAVACTGLFSVLGLAGLRHFYVPLYLALAGFPTLILALRFLGASLVLLLPTFLMGGTFPVLIRAFSWKSEGIERATEMGWGISRLYSVNTLGAVAGTLAAGFTLIPQLGLRASVACAASLNVIAAMIAFCLARSYSIANASESGGSTGQDMAPAASHKVSESSPTLLLIAFGAVGATAMTYEIAWARLLSTVLGSSTYAFTLMLSTFLVGIVLGSILYERSSARHPGTKAGFAHTQTVTALAALLFLAFFRELPALIPPILRVTHQTFGGLVLAQFLTCALAMLPAAVAFGFNFPAAVMLIAASTGRGLRTAEAVGLAYAANTSGAIFAALAAGFFLVPWIGSFRVVALSATLNVLLAAVLLRFVPHRKVLLAINAAIAALAVFAGWSPVFYDRGLASFGTVLYWNHRSERLTFGERTHLQDTVFLQDGLNATIAVSRSDGFIALKTNGKVDASTLDAETQLLLGHLGAIFHPHPQKVFVIGFGSGMTVSALLRYPDVERLDCIEIEPAVLRAAPFLEKLNRGVLSDPRLHLVLEDARNALLTARDRYDLIVSEPSNPWIAGIATLYTDEYYRTVRQHLAPGGIFVQWIQGYSLEPSDLSMILATIVPHFPDVTLWHSTGPADLVLLARTDTKPLDFDRSRALWREPRLREDFESLWLTRPEGWPVAFALNDSEVRVLAQGSMRNTDDRTLLEYRAPHAMIGTSHVTEITTAIKRVQNGLLPPELRDSERRAALEAAAESSLALPDSRSWGYVHALDAEPATPSLEVVRGRQSLRENQIGLALEHFQRALGLAPNDIDALIWLARAKHLTPGDTEGAVLLNQVLQRDPQNLEALADRVDIAIERRDWQAAAEAQAARIRALKNPTSSAYCRLGNLLARTSDMVSAAQAFRTGIDRDSYSYLCHLGLGEIARTNGRFDEALQDFEFVVRYYPDVSSGVYLSMAAVYRAQGNFSRAQEILNKGHRIFPDDSMIMQMIQARERQGANDSR